VLVTLRGLDQGTDPMASTNVACVRDSAQVRSLLDSPEISALIARLAETRWTEPPRLPAARDGRRVPGQGALHASDPDAHGCPDP
jgi:hypothetical protein